MSTSKQPSNSRDAVRSPLTKAVGQRLAQLRFENSFSQAQMAGELGVSTNGYQNYEHGTREAPLGLLVKLHSRFGVDPLWMLTGEDPGVCRWTPEALSAIKDAVWITDTAAKQSHVDLEPEQKARLVAHLVQYGITDADSVNELLSLKK